MFEQSNYTANNYYIIVQYKLNCILTHLTVQNEKLRNFCFWILFFVVVVFRFLSLSRFLIRFSHYECCDLQIVTNMSTKFNTILNSPEN